MASISPGMDLSMIPSASPPSGVLPNFINPPTLATVIITVSSLTAAFASFSLIGRLYSSLRIARSPGSDDVTVVLGFVFSLGYSGLVISTKRFARHAWDLPIMAYTPSYFKIILAETFVGAFALLFSKVSILLLLLRLFSKNRRARLMIYGGISLASLISLTSIIVASVLCTPRGSESFDSLPTIERCSHEDKWAVVQGVLYSALDLYILYLPIPLVWALQMRLRTKIGVLSIFLTGLVACVASITSLAYKVRLLESSDTLWNSYRVDILNIVEVNIAIVVASMPACASCFRHLFSSIKSYIEIRNSSAKTPSTPSSSEKFSHPKDQISWSGPGKNGPPFPEPTQSRDQKARYWKLRDWRCRGETPPQITAVQRQSGYLLRSGDFDAVVEKSFV